MVDDVEENRELVSFLLREAGAEVSLASDGKQALAVLARDPSISLVFMDMQMPVLDGYAATRQLRNRGSHVPVIAMTANNTQGDAEKCRAVGCNGFVAKPIDFEILLEKAESLCIDTPQESRLSEIEDTQAASDESSVENAELDVPEIRQPEDAEHDLEAIMSKLSHEFLDEVSERWGEIEASVREKDVETLKQVAHWIRGTGSTFGFDSFERCMSDLEQAIRLADHDRVDSIFDEFTGEFRKATSGRV